MNYEQRTVTDLETTALEAARNCASWTAQQGFREDEHAKVVAAVRELARRAEHASREWEHWKDDALAEERRAEAAEADRDKWREEALDRGRQIVALNTELAEAGVALRDAEADRDRWRNQLADETGLTEQQRARAERAAADRDRLQAQLAVATATADLADEAADKAEAEAQTLRDALNFYAENNFDDGGDIARAALATPDTPPDALEDLLAEGKVEAALLLKGDGWTDSDREIARQAWEAGLAAGKQIAAAPDTPPDA